MVKEALGAYPEASMSRLCSLFNIPRSSFYSRPKPAAKDDQALLSAIEELLERTRSYGTRRVAKGLRLQGCKVGRKRVQRLMRGASLLCRVKRKWVNTTDSKHGLRRHPNIARSMVLTGKNQLWVSDITYIRLRRGFCYLAAVIDAYSRSVVGWHLSRNIDTELVATSLKKAIASRNPAPGWVHHSDQGSQYAGGDYVKLVLSSGGQMSMSTKACPYDNAKAESFFATLKKEAVHNEEMDSFEEVQTKMKTFIEQYYNNERLHSKLGFQSPRSFEAKIEQEHSSAA